MTLPGWTPAQLRALRRLTARGGKLWYIADAMRRAPAECDLALWALVGRPHLLEDAKPKPAPPPIPELVFAPMALPPAPRKAATTFAIRIAAPPQVQDGESPGTPLHLALIVKANAGRGFPFFALRGE